MDYPLNDIEADIRPEDFPPDSVWCELVKYCGPAALIILAKYKNNVSGQLSIRDYEGFIRGARHRHFSEVE